MKAVTSKFNSFPWAFTAPVSTEGQDAADLRIQYTKWLLDNDLKFQRDYIMFDIETSKKSRRGLLQCQETETCLCFRDRGKALMFKMTWA